MDISPIQTQSQYEDLMKDIDTLMKKGEQNLTLDELEQLIQMAEMAEEWENGLSIE